jgi:hypothetical protein
MGVSDFDALSRALLAKNTGDVPAMTGNFTDQIGLQRPPRLRSQLSKQ